MCMLAVAGHPLEDVLGPLRPPGHPDQPMIMRRRKARLARAFGGLRNQLFNLLVSILLECGVHLLGGSQ